MSLKEEARGIVAALFGPINAERVDALNDSNPKEFLDQVKQIIAAMLGDTAAEKNLAHLYEKYK